MTISCCSILSSVLAMLFFASIARNMFRVCSVNRVACEAALFAVEAIIREIGKEVTIMLREVMMMVIKSKSNRTTSGNLLESFKSFSKDAKIKRSNSITIVEFFVKERTPFH
jgi:hypothetical protein